MNQIVTEYYDTLNKHEDFESFLSFYDEQIVLEDIINGDRIVGKEALRKFFDWDNPDLKILDTNNLIVDQKIIEDRTSVVTGHFNKFQWGQTIYGPMHFTTILTFNTSGKIIKQVDWINYPSNLVNYNERKNSNEWID